MRDDELKTRLGRYAAWAERWSRPVAVELLHRRGRRQYQRLAAATAVLLVALVGIGVALGGSRDEQGPVTTATTPASTAQPPGSLPPTTSRPGVATSQPGTGAVPRMRATMPLTGGFISPSEAQLLSPTVGWLLTTEQLAWTQDGGGSWRPITPPGVAAGRLRGAFFLDTRAGWAIESQRPASPSAGSSSNVYAWRTADGGASWRRSALGQVSFSLVEGSEVQVELQFTDRLHGWMAAGTAEVAGGALRYGAALFATDDGGVTWEQRSAPSSIWALRFTTPSDGWAVVDGSKLDRTRDGGRTWRSVTLPQPADLPGLDRTLEGPPTFFERRKGVLLASFAQGQRVKAIGAYQTSDGGATWSITGTARVTSHPVQGVALAALDPRTLVAVAGAGGGWLLRSDDGGRTWSTAPTRGVAGVYAGLHQMAFADAGHGWAFTPGSEAPVCDDPRNDCREYRTRLLVTRDGGRTWSRAS